MKPTQIINVTTNLPPQLARLKDLAYNLRWSWSFDSVGLFRWLDEDLWEAVDHNPVKLLDNIAQDKLDAAAQDDAFLAHLEHVVNSLDTYMEGETSWFQRTRKEADPPLVAYFSAEFGVTECLPIFAGGLGILAGDHLKSASDLGLPLVAVGLLYQQGYSRQILNRSGWQQVIFDKASSRDLPVEIEQIKGAAAKIDVPMGDHTIKVQIWRAQVGRIPLYLLDTNLDENNPSDRTITDRLYGGDREMRLRQEILLGIGGCIALEALGIQPTICHMNEGHCAFVALERTRQAMTKYKLTFAQASEAVSPGLVFTTHTPEPAGHDYFAPDLMERYFAPYAKSLGITVRDLMTLGRKDAGNEAEHFCMTILALRMAWKSNAVSRLHGEVSRDMWKDLWPGMPVSELPIGYVTNGVHFRSWVSHDMETVYDRYLRPQWRREPVTSAHWQRIEHCPAAEIWTTHERRRERLVAFTRHRLRIQLESRGLPPYHVAMADEVLHPEALTIVFARRFVSYKRVLLLLRDPDRLAKIVNDPGRPVQIIFAGKAHPDDPYGHDAIQKIIGLARQDRFRNRMVFIEGYDLGVARYLVQGADVWLNNPRRPHEACGTSGMKAAANGALNLSTLDGWWDEAWDLTTPGDEPIGWNIGGRDSYSNEDEQDQIEANAIYDLLENDIIPTFYDRGPDQIPRRWVNRMKSTIRNLCAQYNSHRMVSEYIDGFYLPGSARYKALVADKMADAVKVSAWREKVKSGWADIRINITEAAPENVMVGEEICVRAVVKPGSLKQEDIRVELCTGLVDANGEIANPLVTVMTPAGSGSGGQVTYQASGVRYPRSGRYGMTARVVPAAAERQTVPIPGCITWA